MADNKATIEVDFDLNMQSLNKQIDELQERINNADLENDDIQGLLQDQRLLNIEINKFVDSLTEAEKQSEVFKAFQSKIEALNESANSLRETWQGTQAEADGLAATLSNTKGIMAMGAVAMGTIAAIKTAIDGLKVAFNLTKQAGLQVANVLVATFKKVTGVITNLAESIATNFTSKISSIVGSIQGLLNIDLRSLGTRALDVALDFKNLGTTSEIVARQMSNAFYESAGESYESLVKMSNGTAQVTATLKSFINTWTGQVALMKAQLTSIGANIGNLLIKVFYPLLVVLNKVLAVVNTLLSKIAALFGFDTSSMSKILGQGQGGQSALANKGLEDYSKAQEKAAKSTKKTTKATDKAAKSQKKLNKETKETVDNLQGYDKLNNITTNNLDDITDQLNNATDELGDIDGLDDIGGLIDTDALLQSMQDSLFKLPEWLNKWIDELVRLVKNGDWYGLGEHIGSLVNKGLYALADFLEDPNLTAKLKKFNGALLDFVNGVLDKTDWKQLGKDIALAFNTIAFEINDLYKQAVEKGTLKKIGTALHDSFVSFATNINAGEVGQSITTAMRAVIDIMYEALSKMNDTEVDLIATKIYEFIDGAFERLLGDIENTGTTGAEKIGTIIAKLINMGLASVAKLTNEDTGKKVADAIIQILNGAIEGLDENNLTAALSGLMNFIGTLLSKLATEIKTDEFIGKVSGAINESAKNGSVTNMVAGLTKFVHSIFDSIKSIIKSLDFGSLFKAIVDGFNEGDGLSVLADWFEFVAAPILIASLAKGVVVGGAAYLGFKKMLAGGLATAAGEAAAEAGAANAGAGLLESLFGGGAALLGSLLKFAGVAGGAIVSVTALIDGYNNGFNAINSTMGILGATLAGGLIAGPIGALTGAVGAFLIELNKMGQDSPEVFASIGESIGNFVGKAIVDLYQFGQDVSSSVSTAFTNAKNNITNITNAIGTDLSNHWNSFKTNAVTSWNNMWTNVGNGITQAKANISQKCQGIVNSIKQTFANFVSSAKQLGTNIVNGLAQGISSAASSVIQQAQSLANSVKNTISSALQIHSPSRVMEDLGIFIPQGLALGIEDGEDDVTSAVNQMADSIKFADFYDESLNETDAFVDSVNDKLAELQSPELDPLQYQSKMLKSPSSAARALSQSYSDMNAQKTDGVLSSIYSRILGSGQVGGSGNVVVDVYLDKNNKLGRYIIDTMKGQVVMTGGV